MGFSQIVGQLAFIFIFLIMTAFLVSSYFSYVDSTSSDAIVMQEALNNKLKSNLEVTDYFYTFGTTVLTVKNTGSISFNPDLIDVFSDGVRVNRDFLTIELLDTNYDPLYWNPQESVNITVGGWIFSSAMFQVSTEYGASAYQLVEP